MILVPIKETRMHVEKEIQVIGFCPAVDKSGLENVVCPEYDTFCATFNTPCIVQIIVFLKWVQIADVAC